jgi:hypothetical protein
MPTRLYVESLKLNRRFGEKPVDLIGPPCGFSAPPVWLQRQISVGHRLAVSSLLLDPKASSFSGKSA